MQLPFDVVSDRESFKMPEASLSTQDPGKINTYNPNDTFLEHQQGEYKSNLQNLPIVAEIMIYDVVVKKIASSVPLGIATAGFWVKR